MKIVIALLAALVLTPASALAQKRIAVPTGIDVKGCGQYVLTYSGRVVQRCRHWRFIQTDMNNPQADVRSRGE